MRIISEEDGIKAMDKAGEILGADPAYFGEEGAEEVFKQLLLLGYTEEEIRKSRGY